MKVIPTYSERHAQRVKIMQRRRLLNSIKVQYGLALFVFILWLLASSLEFHRLMN